MEDHPEHDDAAPMLENSAIQSFWIRAKARGKKIVYGAVTALLLFYGFFGLCWALLMVWIPG